MRTPNNFRAPHAYRFKNVKGTFLPGCPNPKSGWDLSGLTRSMGSCSIDRPNASVSAQSQASWPKTEMWPSKLMAGDQYTCPKESLTALHLGYITVTMKLHLESLEGSCSFLYKVIVYDSRSATSSGKRRRDPYHGPKDKHTI
jgi:hypothetical protein